MSISSTLLVSPVDPKILSVPPSWDPWPAGQTFQRRHSCLTSNIIHSSCGKKSPSLCRRLSSNCVKNCTRLPRIMHRTSPERQPCIVGSSFRCHVAAVLLLQCYSVTVTVLQCYSVTVMWQQSSQCPAAASTFADQ